MYDGPHATPTKTDQGPWYLSISSLNNGRFDLSLSAHLSEEDYGGWTRRVTPQPGDTLFSYETRIGSVAHWPFGFPAALGRRMGLLRPRREVVDPRFLTYSYMGPQFQEVLRANTVHGATVERLLIAQMPKWEMLLPSLAEQRGIAGVLGAFDDLIDTNRELVARMEALLASLFEEQGFDSNGGDGVLADVLAVNPFYPKPKGEAPYVDMAALPTRGARVETVSSRVASGGARFTTGDTLLARITPCLENGKTAYVDFLDSGSVGVGSTEFIVLRDAIGVSPHWPYFLARSERFRSYAIRHMTGTSGRQRCPADAIARYPIDLPDPVELRRFEKVAGPLFDAMKQLDDESEQLAATRDELLPLLMSGRVTMDEAWEAVPA